MGPGQDCYLLGMSAALEWQVDLVGMEGRTVEFGFSFELVKQWVVVEPFVEEHAEEAEEAEEAAKSIVAGIEAVTGSVEAGL